MDEKHLKIFARLYSKAALQKAAIENDPGPHLIRAAERIEALERAIEDAVATLDGADNLDLALDVVTPQTYPGVVETVTLRNDKAREVLEAALGR